MARKCEVSGKGPMSGNTRSHALNASRRKWNVNLQKATILVNGKPKKVKISARELRTLRKISKKEVNEEVEDEELSRETLIQKLIDYEKYKEIVSSRYPELQWGITGA